MQRIYVFVFCSVLGLLPAVHVLPAYAQQSPRVVVSEINWGGSDRGIADEWFELANRDAQPADISGWSVTGMATGGGNLTFADGTVIPAYGIYLVANYGVSDASTLAVTPDLVTTAVSIPNTKLTVTLTASDGTMLDSLTDPGTPDFGSAAMPFATMERDLATLAWSNATTSTNLTDTTQFGTPGSASVPQVIEAAEIENPVVESPDIDEVIVEPVPTEEPVIENAVISTENIDEQPIVIEVTPVEIVDEVAIEPIVVVIDEPVITEPRFVLDVILEAVPPIQEPITDMTVVETPTAIVEEIVPTELVATPIIEEAPAASAPPTETDSAVVDPSTASSVGESGDLAAAVTHSSAGDVVVENVVDEAPVAASIPTTGALQLNEIFVDGDEWIEVRNADTHDIDATPWVVRDASGKTTTLGAFVLAPNALLVIHAPSGKLNNDGDSVELLDGAGTVIDRIVYGTDDVPAPNEEESLVRTTDGWFVLTTITEGATNPLIAPVRETPTEEAAEAPAQSAPESASLTPQAATIITAPTYVVSANTPAPIVSAHAVASSAPAKAAAAESAAKQTIGTKSTDKTSKKPTAVVKKTAITRKTTKTSARVVTDVRTAEDGTLVRYTGTVIALPGTFGNQVMFVDGAAVYSYHADWPTLTVGDVVTVEGEVSTARGEKRIKITSATAITVGEYTDVQPIAATALDTTQTSRLVRIDGVVSARDGDALMVTVGNNTIRVVASAQSAIRWSTLTGAHVVITGIVRQLDGQFVLMPRSTDDITVERDEVISTARVTPHFPTRSVLGGGVLTSTAGMLGYWFVRSRTLIPNL